MRLQIPSHDFESHCNHEIQTLQDIRDDYEILSAVELDSDGVPYPAMVTGFDLIPKYEHYELLSLRISEVYRCTLEDALNLSASEFLRRLAMCKASKWSQDSDATRAHNKELKRRGK